MPAETKIVTGFNIQRIWAIFPFFESENNFGIYKKVNKTNKREGSLKNKYGVNKTF